MANIDLKFIDEHDSSITSKVVASLGSINITICYGETSTEQTIFLDVSTAIMFATTLRTEINKLKDEKTN